MSAAGHNGLVPADWPDESSLCQVVKACNEGVRKMSRTEQMISIQKKMEFKIKVSLARSGSSHAHPSQRHRQSSLYPCAPSPVVEALCPDLPSESCGPSAACLCDCGTVTTWLILSSQCMGSGTLSAEGLASHFLFLDFW